MLEEEQALLEKVVETLSNDIEEKEEKIEKLRRCKFEIFYILIYFEIWILV